MRNLKSLDLHRTRSNMTLHFAPLDTPGTLLLSKLLLTGGDEAVLCAQARGSRALPPLNRLRLLIWNLLSL